MQSKNQKSSPNNTVSVLHSKFNYHNKKIKTNSKLEIINTLSKYQTRRQDPQQLSCDNSECALKSYKWVTVQPERPLRSNNNYYTKSS